MEELEPQVEQGTLGIYYLNKLFERHGVKKTDRARALMQESVFGMTYQTAHRRLNGGSPWSVDELRTVANHYGETLKQMIDRSEPNLGEHATLVVGSVRKHCRVWLGPAPKTKSDASELVAVRQGKTIQIVPAGEVGSTDVCHLVTRLTIERAQRVAVLDDNKDVAQSISEYLRSSGFEVDTFNDTESLQATSLAYDAFVLDWIVKKKSTTELIKTIRSNDQSCCIVVITGEVDSGNVPASEVTEAAAAYKCVPLFKPTKMEVISATLTSFTRKAKV